MKVCHYCKQDDGYLRPYGPNGDWICFTCATATPERETAALQQLAKQFEAAAAGGRGPISIIVLDENGPHPLIPSN